MTSLPCSSRSKRVYTKISILALSFIGHLECPGISEAFFFERQPFVFYTQSYENKRHRAVGTFQILAIHLLIESFKGVLSVNDREISPNFNPLKCFSIPHNNTSFLFRDLGKKFGVV